MADKIDQIKIGSTSYDIDLPPDATPIISNLTVSEYLSFGQTTSLQSDNDSLGSHLYFYDATGCGYISFTYGGWDDEPVNIYYDYDDGNDAASYLWKFPTKEGTIALTSDIPSVLSTGASNKDKYLHTNASTGALEWSTVTSGANYYPVRVYSSGFKISDYSGSTNCQLYVPYATTTQKGVVEIMTDAEMDAQTGGTTPSSTVNPIVDLVYPIGSIYMSTTDSTVAQVQARFVGTTWVKIEGRFLLGAGSNTANTTTTYGSLSAGSINRTTIGEQGGEVKHQLTLDEMPTHSHGVAREFMNMTSGSSPMFSASGSYATTTDSNGGNQTHNNMPPYYVVYMYRRTV